MGSTRDAQLLLQLNSAISSLSFNGPAIDHVVSLFSAAANAAISERELQETRDKFKAKIETEKGETQEAGNLNLEVKRQRMFALQRASEHVAEIVSQRAARLEGKSQARVLTDQEKPWLQLKNRFPSQIDKLAAAREAGIAQASEQTARLHEQKAARSEKERAAEPQRFKVETKQFTADAKDAVPIHLGFGIGNERLARDRESKGARLPDVGSLEMASNGVKTRLDAYARLLEAFSSKETSFESGKRAIRRTLAASISKELKEMQTELASSSDWKTLGNVAERTAEALKGFANVVENGEGIKPAEQGKPLKGTTSAINIHNGFVNTDKAYFESVVATANTKKMQPH